MQLQGLREFAKLERTPPVAPRPLTCPGPPVGPPGMEEIKLGFKFIIGFTNGVNVWFIGVATNVPVAPRTKKPSNNDETFESRLNCKHNSHHDPS